MSFMQKNPRFSHSRREKLFGDGRPRPLNRNDKSRIMFLARAYKRRTEKGKAYGRITAKALDVLQALLWTFHNARSGLCFPSYETIAKTAGCARSTVAKAIIMLEQAGILTWVNRLVRIRVLCRDLCGRLGPQTKVIRTSNGYCFTASNKNRTEAIDSKSKSEKQTETYIQELPYNSHSPDNHQTSLSTPLSEALNRLGNLIGINMQEL